MKFHPISKTQTLHRAWDIIITASATLTAVAIPARLVLNMQSEVAVISVSVIITLIFSLDILIRFLLSRSRKGSADGRSGAAKSYAMGWLIVDLLGAIPFGFIFNTSLLHLLRLIKLARIAQFMRQWRQRVVQYANILRLVFFVYWLTLSAHWIACGWLALRGVTATGDSASDYIRALYWTIQTLSTVGYGDLTPATSAQTLYAMGVMMIGVGVYGYIIGNVASILAKIDPAKVFYLENMERLTAFMNYRNIPPRLQRRIRDYYAYLWEKRLSYDESTIITSLPPSLQTDVSLFLKRDIIEKVPLFQGASDEFIREIALQMTPVIFIPGDYVYKAGESGRDMYFITRGTVEVVSKDGAEIYTTLSDGEFFGEIALVHNQPRTASVRAVSYCDLYRLDKDMFDRVLAHYPEIAAQIQAKARERNRGW